MKNTMPASGRGLRSRKGTALVLAASAMAAALATADDAMTVTTNGTEVTVNVPSRATLAEIPGSDITKQVYLHVTNKQKEKDAAILKSITI